MRSRSCGVGLLLEEEHRIVGGDEGSAGHREVDLRAVRPIYAILRFRYDIYLPMPCPPSLSRLFLWQQNKGRFELGGSGCK